MDFIVKHFGKLQEKYRFPKVLKEEQKEAVNLLCNNKDVFVCLPTGFGKTLCMVLPPLLLNEEFPEKQHCVLIVSPLKSLIEDQYTYLKEHNICCMKLGEEEGLDSASVILSSPEFLNKTNTRIKLQRMLSHRIHAIIYDECHCVCKWGNTFRPDYAKVTQVQSWFNCCVMALSATITSKMKDEVFKALGLDTDCALIAKIPDRKNIQIAVKECTEHFEEELQWVMEHTRKYGADMEKMLIFCKSIDACQKIYNWLMFELDKGAYKGGRITLKNRLLEMYHSGTDPKSKDRILEAFRTDSALRIVIGTIAFGMGVNIPNVRHVIMWGMPDSVLDLWQLIGRGGRDGTQSKASCYAFPRSKLCMKCKTMQCKCPFSDRDCIQQALMEKSCIRTMILTNFVLNDKMKAEIQVSKDICCDNNCSDVCLCPSCKCCTACALKCLCEYKFV